MSTDAQQPFTVLIVQEWIPAYRTEFFATLAKELRQHNVTVTLAYGDPPRLMASRRDSVSIPSALYRSNKVFGGERLRVIWQPWWRAAHQHDLVILNEGARFLLNYGLIARHFQGRCTVAFWGHGANLNTEAALGISEAVKRRLYRLPHWWFAYTEGAKRRVEGLGYPSDRITVVQNTTPVEALREKILGTGRAEMVEWRRKLKLGDGPVGLYIGSLYPGKRVEYLIEAADYIVTSCSTFSLVVAGDGPDRERLATLAAERPYIRLAGRADGDAKAALLKLASLLLTPGAVGLSITDGFAAGLPTVTVAEQAHGPEIEYLEDGVNGRLLPVGSSPAEYAEGVVELLTRHDELLSLSHEAWKSGGVYTESEMVRRFAAGVCDALNS